MTPSYPFIIQSEHYHKSIADQWISSAQREITSISGERDTTKAGIV